MGENMTSSLERGCHNAQTIRLRARETYLLKRTGAPESPIRSSCTRHDRGPVRLSVRMH